MESKFMIRCKKCRWAKITNGSKEELKDLHEVKNHCSDCGKPRKFRCPQCGMPSPMQRINA